MLKISIETLGYVCELEFKRQDNELYDLLVLFSGRMVKDSNSFALHADAVSPEKVNALKKCISSILLDRYSAGVRVINDGTRITCKGPGISISFQPAEEGVYGDEFMQVLEKTMSAHVAEEKFPGKAEIIRRIFHA